jgi:hypothetical protein
MYPSVRLETIQVQQASRLEHFLNFSEAPYADQFTTRSSRRGGSLHAELLPEFLILVLQLHRICREGRP